MAQLNELFEWIIPRERQFNASEMHLYSNKYVWEIGAPIKFVDRIGWAAHVSRNKFRYRYIAGKDVPIPAPKLAKLARFCTHSMGQLQTWVGRCGLWSFVWCTFEQKWDFGLWPPRPLLKPPRLKHSFEYIRQVQRRIGGFPRHEQKNQFFWTKLRSCKKVF